MRDPLPPRTVRDKLSPPRGRMPKLIFFHAWSFTGLPAQATAYELTLPAVRQAKEKVRSENRRGRLGRGLNPRRNAPVRQGRIAPRFPRKCAVAPHDPGVARHGQGAMAEGVRALASELIPHGAPPHHGKLDAPALFHGDGHIQEENVSVTADECNADPPCDVS